MKKLFVFSALALLVLIIMPNTARGMTVSFDTECGNHSRWDPFYNATISSELTQSDISFIRMKFKVIGPNVEDVEGRESHVNAHVKACPTCTVFPVSGIAPGQLVGVDVDAAQGSMEIDVLMSTYIINEDTEFSLSFYYCDDWNNKPFVSELANLCSSFVGNLPDQCPHPETAEPPLPNPFQGATAEISITPIEGNDNYVIMDIDITGNMMHILAGEPLAYITPWRKYGNMTSTNYGKQIELIDNGNNNYTLRIRVLEQAKNKFAGTSFKIVYENPNAIPPRLFEFNIEKLCSKVVSVPQLPLFCTPAIVPMPIKPVIPMIESEE